MRHALLLLVLAHAAFAQTRLDGYRSASAEATDREFPTGEGSWAAAELMDTSGGVYDRLLLLGWPTTQDAKKLLSAAGDVGTRQVEALAFFSGAGLSLEYGPLVQDAFLLFAKSEKPKKFAEGWKSSADCLNWKLAAFAEKVGLSQAPAGLMPIFLPQAKSLPEYTQAYVARDGATARWDLTGVAQNPIHPGSVGLYLSALARYSRAQLGQTRVENRKTLVGATAHDGYYGMIAAYTLANATLGLNHKSLPLLCMNGQPKESPLKGYDPFKSLAYFPQGMVAELSAKTGRYNPGVTDPRSLLFDQAALLLGLSDVLGFATDARFSDLLHSKRDEEIIVPPAVAETARGLAALIFENLLAQHFEPSVGSFDSEWTGSGLPGSRSGELRLVDAGLVLVALERYRQEMVTEGDSERVKQILRFLKPQVEMILSAQQADGSFPEVFNLDRKKPSSKDFSLAAQGMVLQGLVAARRSLDPALVTRVDAALSKLLALLDSRWVPRLQVFFTGADKDSANLKPADVAAIVGGLRSYALEIKDIRAYYRLIATLDGLLGCGILRPIQSEIDLPGALPLSEGGGFGSAPVFYGEIYVRFRE